MTALVLDFATMADAIALEMKMDHFVNVLTHIITIMLVNLLAFPLVRLVKAMPTVVYLVSLATPMSAKQTLVNLHQ